MKILILLAFLSVRAETRTDTLGDSLRQQLTQLRTEINAVFALYEVQITTCLQTKNLIRDKSLETLENNLKELQALKELSTSQELSIVQLQAIRTELQGSLIEVNKILKKLKRRLVIERIASSTVIATLTYFLITRPP
jgi:hypothetical protein